MKLAVFGVQVAAFLIDFLTVGRRCLLLVVRCSWFIVDWPRTE